jgi:hypothetical protein
MRGDNLRGQLQQFGPTLFFGHHSAFSSSSFKAWRATCWPRWAQHIFSYWCPATAFLQLLE